MGIITATVNKITPVDDAFIASVKTGPAAALHNISGLGGLYDIFLNYAAITGQINPRKPKKAAVIACADHGVCAMKVSAYPQKTTIDMTRNYLINKGAVANAMTNFSGADMLVVDMGIAANLNNLPGLINKKIALGTNNFTDGPAMSENNAKKALITGINIANELVRKKYNCFLLGEMGIANTTSSAAIAAAICGLSPEQATGRGTNISDSRLQTKIAVVKKALAVNAPRTNDGIDVLTKIGGFEFGCLAGIILGAAANNCLVILDGFNTAAAALIAQAICPASATHLMPSHLAGEPAHQAALKKLGLSPYIDLHLQLSETAGSAVICRFIELAVELYDMVRTNSVPASTAFTTLPINTALQLNDSIMHKCQERIDNLTKPIHCLGKFEEIAVYLAGALQKERPLMSDIIINKNKLLPYIIQTSHCLKKPVTNSYAAERIGLILIEGALHMLNDMKTFAEAAVAVANDGPGAGRQKEI
ncbi:nicotinate-nucleotide--dimethylbenzimidazole phosphoribosyltransferase [Pectinatus frisingensis]|uniref:nicotinate-nucleotide--dimethylbenzimidazole phosphoribosyltransferase n=1 Tax=Pectinatus frisingensis TaxID=865 RepID=UPI0018C45DF1|nr:nicotinate-nucleotide--dimethylbenzimidazole phosphoribosyltransferase [Pectinatus frisingensis]